LSDDEEPINFAPMLDMMMGKDGQLPSEAKMLSMLKNHACIEDFNSEDSFS